MKVELQDLEPCRKGLSISAGADETRDVYNNVASQFSRHGKIPGFRSGKAPRSVVEKRFASRIAERVRSELTPKLYQDAIKQEGVTVVSVVKVSDVDFSRDDGINFSVVVDVAPEFKLPKYKKISVKGGDETVSDEDLEESLERLRVSYASYDDVKEDDESATIEEGDMVQVDYSGTIDDKPISERVSDCENLGEAVDLWTQCEKPGALPGIVRAMTGLSLGEEKEFTAKFKKDFHVEAVQGKSGRYTMKVKAIRKRALPEFDEEFFKKIGVKDRDELRSKMREHMEQIKKNAETSRKRDEICQYLLKKCTFDLPQSVVAQERQLAARSLVQQAMRDGATREQLQDQQEAITKAADQQGTDRVRLGYILTRIAELENIEISEEQVKDRAHAMAPQYQMSPADLWKELQDNNGVERLRSDIRNDRVMDMLLNEAKVK